MTDDQIKKRLACRGDALIVVPQPNGTFSVYVVTADRVTVPIDDVHAIATNGCPIDAAREAMRRADA